MVKIESHKSITWLKHSQQYCSIGLCTRMRLNVGIFCTEKFLYTLYGKILSKDRSWTITKEKMALTDSAYFMHCLPVRRNMIVSDDVIEGPRSIVIPEAANREISAMVVLKRILETL